MPLVADPVAQSGERSEVRMVGRHEGNPDRLVLGQPLLVVIGLREDEFASVGSIGDLRCSGCPAQTMARLC